jgi:hypothetical protein
MKRIKELFLRSHPPPVLSVSICSPISKSAESQTATPIPSPSTFNPFPDFSLKLKSSQQTVSTPFENICSKPLYVSLSSPPSLSNTTTRQLLSLQHHHHGLSPEQEHSKQGSPCCQRYEYRLSSSVSLERPKYHNSAYRSLR